MSFVTITTDSFKAYFTRDFPYGADQALHILDSDINRAINVAFPEINQALFRDQANFDIGLNYLSAHYLVMNINEASQGIAGKFEWTVNSKGVGSVSVAASIPDRLAKDPKVAMLSTTNYGARYLNMIFPLLVGQVFIVKGCTTA